MKKCGLLILIVCLFLFLFSFPEEAFSASRQGMNLWLNTLLPTLLPSMILSNLLIESGLLVSLCRKRFFKNLSSYSIYVTVLGILCGYPMGAKICADLYRKGYLSHKEARMLLTFCNNPSPMFLSGYVLLHCLHRGSWILPSFLILYLADFFCAILFFFLFSKNMKDNKMIPKTQRTKLFQNSRKNQNMQLFQDSRNTQNTQLSQDSQTISQYTTGIASDVKKEKSTSNTSSAYIDLSIMNGFETITRMGGYILLFSLCAAMINHFWPKHFPGRLLLSGTLEISTGLSGLAASALPVQMLYPAAMGLTAFGGICTLAQTGGVLAGSGLSLRTYLISKCVCTALTTLLALIFVIQIV